MDSAKTDMLYSREQLNAAWQRLLPYIEGYPEPMIDTRRLRIANGTASQEDIEEVGAEDYLIKKIMESKL